MLFVCVKSSICRTAHVFITSLRNGKYDLKFSGKIWSTENELVQVRISIEFLFTLIQVIFQGKV